MRRAKIDHEMAIGDLTYPADTIIEVLSEKFLMPEGEYVLARFPDGEEWGVPDFHLRKEINEDGGKYWLKSRHDIEASPIHVTIVDEDGERSFTTTPEVEHL